MELDRREFLKLSGVSAGSLLVTGPSGTDLLVVGSPKTFPLGKKIGQTSSICAFCAGGCGILVNAEGGKVVSIEGDPDHPINWGALCSKAQALYQTRTVGNADNARRLKKVLYRASGGTAWEEKSWDWALAEMAKKIKQTRDASFIEKDKDGVVVNRTEAIAMVGGSAHDNEEAYLITKMNRALGLVYQETQARI